MMKSPRNTGLFQVNLFNSKPFYLLFGECHVLKNAKGSSYCLGTDELIRR